MAALLAAMGEAWLQQRDGGGSRFALLVFAKRMTRDSAALSTVQGDGNGALPEGATATEAERTVDPVRLHGAAWHLALRLLGFTQGM